MAYYSNQGAQIHSAASGLGVDAGPLRSYQDGSLGDPGALMSFQDGSLGMPLYLQTPSGGMQKIDEPMTIIHGDVPAPPPLRGAGEYFAPNGMGEYFATSGLGGCNSCGLGQAADEVILDMKNPEVVREVKIAMGMAPWMVPFISGPAESLEFDEGFFENPIWDAESTRFAQHYVEGMKAAIPSSAALADSMFVAPSMFPNAFGITNILQMAGYKGASPSINFKAELPITTDFFDATVSVAGEPAGKPSGRVNPPFLSLEEKQGGGLPIKASTLALLGAGVVGLIAIVMLTGKKRR